MGKLTPKRSRYVEVPHPDTSLPSSIIRDNVTGETILVIGTREQQITVLCGLNIAEGSKSR